MLHLYLEIWESEFTLVPSQKKQNQNSPFILTFIDHQVLSLSLSPLIFFFFFKDFLIYLFIYLFIYFWLCWVFGSCEGFLQSRQAGATLHRGAGTALHRGARAFHYRGPSRCGAQAPDAQAQQLWPTGPAAPWHVGSSQTRARTRVSCISRQILNHCATREAQQWILVTGFEVYIQLILCSLPAKQKHPFGRALSQRCERETVLFFPGNLAADL